MAKGAKTGGRKAGTPNRASAAKAAAVAASGLTPLEYLTSVYRDADVPRVERVEAAKAAAPYVHPKLASIEHKGGGVGGLCLILVDEDDPRAQRPRYAAETTSRDATPDGAVPGSQTGHATVDDSLQMLGGDLPQPIDRRPPVFGFGENNNPRPAPQIQIED